MSSHFTVAACSTWLVQPVRLRRSRFALVLLAVLLVSLGLLLAPGSAHAAPPAPVTDLRAQRSDTSVILRWTHSDVTAHHYEVWWSDSPYAVPGDAGMVMIATVTPGATPSEVTYTDTASGVGNTAVNSFYAVRGVTAGGEASALSNRAGEFDFGLPVAGPLPTVNHCGTISTNQNWGPNAVHRLTCNVTVASGVKLTVLAGTVVKFLPSTGLFAQGTLNAAGTKTNPIVFTSIKQDAYGGDSNGDGGASIPAVGDWYGIFLDGAGASASLLDHAIVEYGSQQLNNWHGGNWVNNVVFWHADGILMNSEVRYGNWAVHAEGNTGIYSNTIKDNSNSGIYVVAGNVPIIRANTFQNNGRCAVDAPLDDIPSITDNQFLGPDANDGICGRGTTIAANGAWQNQAVPYRISGSMVVGGGVTVTMQVGTQLHFLQNSSLRSNGTMESSGADAWVAYNPVTMDGEFTFRQLGVVTNGLLTHSGATTSSESRLAITAITVTVNTGSGIEVTGRGYLGGMSGGNSSEYGRTVGNTTTGGSQHFSGGSHGGLGGQPDYHYPLAGVYGAFTDPNQLGSGGGGYATHTTGGNGGGLIRVTANTLTLNGAIRANGSNGQSNDNSSRAGGGAGGSIRLDVGTLTGSGVIQAIGGNGFSASGDGGGGGGRIAVYYADISGFPTSNISAIGGTGKINGGTGTAFLKSVTQVNGTLVVDAHGQEGANTPLSAGGIPDEFKALNKARVVASAFQAGAVLIDQGSILEIDGTITADDFQVRNGSIVRHPSTTTTHEAALSVQAGSLSIDAGSAIDVTGLGYLGGMSGGNTGNPYGRTVGNTATGGSRQNSGGSHGGLGGQPNGSYPVANVYGTFTDPNQLGSGGGGYDSGSGRAIGGNGGGLICITANTLTLNGAIRSNGGNAWNAGRSITAGGGAGGSVRLDIGTLTGSGVIQAIGGNGLGAGSDGGGGGGRIAVYYTDMSGFPTSNISAIGGTGKINGGTGTTFLKSVTQVNGTLVVDAHGQEGANTPLSAGWIPDEFKALNKARVVTSAFQAGTVLIDQGSILEIDGTIISDDFQVRNGSIVRHPSTTTTHEAALSVQAGSLSIDASSGIDVTGQGYLGGMSGGNSGSSYGRTVGNTTTGGSQQNSGGSHGGLGGQPNGSYPVANVYGTFTDPNQLGSGGGGYDSGSGRAIGGNGGGLIRITANTLTLNGAIRSNGGNAWNAGRSITAGGGAGGSIRLDIGTLTGSGVIQAIGGNGLGAGSDGGGGGGRIAVYYTDMSGFPTSNISAIGGTGKINGGTGTVFLMNRVNYHTYISAPSTPWTQFVAEPVNVILGNYVTQHVDISYPTRGLPVHLERSYNSITLDDGPLGYGWTHSYNLAISRPITGFVSLRNEDGRVDQYTDNGNGTYKPPTGIFDTLISSSDGYTLTRKDQTVYRFEVGGRLLSIADKNGNTTTLAYDPQGRLATVTEPAGRTLTFSYASPVKTTLISQVTDHAARTTQYAYDGAGNLTAVTDPTGQTTHYAYDLNHRLTGITDANGHTFVRNTYDGQGRVTQQRDALDNLTLFDYHAGYTIVTDARSVPITYTYDSGYRITGETDSLGATLSYQYDWDNNRTQVTDKRGNATRYTYDSRGNALTIVDPVGTTTMTYDTTAGRNNLLSEKDRLNRTTSYAYDARSNLTRRTDALNNVTTWAYDAYGQVMSTTDANSHATTYGYDAHGNRTSTTDALGNTTLAAYDVAGRKLTETDPLGRVTTYTYDPANRILSASEPLGKLTEYTYDAVGNRLTVTENGTRTTHYVYDAKDRLTSVTDPLGHATAYGYDAVNNQTVITNALGLATTTTYDALNRRTSVKDALNNTTSYQYDPNNNRTRLTDAKSKATVYTYDVLNRLTGVTDAAGGTVNYGYDATGNRTSMTDANGHTTAYAYDALNRLLSTTDPLSQTVSYAYDAAGNRTAMTKADGTVVGYTYDALNRLIATNTPGGSVSYSYDPVGNRAAMTDTLGVTSYSYDALNRLAQVTDHASRITSYAYDPFGNRASLTYPDSQVITYTYDLANRLTEVMDYALRITTYTYDAANRQIGIAYPNGAMATYTYDNADRLLGIVHTSPVSGTFAVFTYTLDAVGNRLTMRDLDGTTSYTYDNLYRLTKVIYPGGEQVTYAYDPMGNRTAMTSTVNGATLYAYDAADRLLTAGSDTFGWDANGRQITRTFGLNTATYTFDPLDRLTQVVSGTTTVKFAYNGDGVRVRKTINGSVTDLVQDAGVELPVVLVEQTGAQTTINLYGAGQIARFEPDGRSIYYHTDALGNSRALTNQTGQVTDSYAYDTFGALRSHTGDSTQPFGFTGEPMDGEFGLVFLRARYYDPQLGRFIQRDRREGLVSRPESLNRYVYVQNNPASLVDPSGEAWWDAPVAWGQNNVPKLVEYGIKGVNKLTNLDIPILPIKLWGTVEKSKKTAANLASLEPTQEDIRRRAERDCPGCPGAEDIVRIEIMHEEMFQRSVMTLDESIKAIPLVGSGYGAITYLLRYDAFIKQQWQNLTQKTRARSGGQPTSESQESYQGYYYQTSSSGTANYGPGAPPSKGK